ncbi:hypothetical protein EYC80_011108 [Monilinia laxa]|uniref:DUF7514 domain-containing protein n=1 Tax=Monilinia laxa TaxID=61186 RepID=A0A5N6JQN1_MONLA|nr:hypothetical protein EYC80_011108 [Monilinia laxa]
MAHFDAYGRPLRGNSGPGYEYETYETYDFNDPNRHMPAYSNPSTSNRYSAESRDTPYASQSASSVPPHSPQPYSSNNNMGTAYGSDRSTAVDHDTVSPEIIAAITEKVTRKLFDQLKQTGAFDDQPRASYMPREQSEKSNSTNQSPTPSDHRRVYTPPSPTSTTKPSFPPPPTEPMRSPPASPSSDKPFVRFNDRDRGYNDRPTPKVHRTYSTVELSTIDQKWGRLFDSDSRPTERLGQFLRGLANHIVDDFAPKKSIVITPSKMAAYYGAYPIGNKEIHPYVSIFKTLSNNQISKLYQDLGCQHHLVQEDFHSGPTIPALTPLGFAHWMTIQISAYPSEESERLGKVVLALPIDADGQMVDGKPERLPKQISRHLLPDVGDRDSEKLMRTAMSQFSDNLGDSHNSRSKPTASSPPLRQSSPADRPQPRSVDTPEPRASYSAPNSKPLERERMPYAGAPSVTSESSSVDEGSAIQIERERKPYSAQPGNGKMHTESTNINLPNRPGRANSASRVKEPPGRERSRSRHNRTQSTASQDNYKPPPLSSSKRSRSPQFKSYSHSTPSNIDIGSSTYVPSPATFPSTFGPSSYGSNNSFPPPPSSSDHRDPRDRRRDDRPHRRGVEDERFPTTTHVNDFSSPRDAEKWDRLHEGLDSRSSDYDRDRPTKSTGSAFSEHTTRNSYVEPHVAADYEDWYRGNGVDKSMRNSMYY